MQLPYQFVVTMTMMTCLTQSHAFQMPGFRAVATPNLDDYATAQNGVCLSVGLDIRNKHSSSRLYIDGLKIELTNDAIRENTQVKLPGSQGLYALGSTGPLAVKNHSHGKFISTKGEQIVHLHSGCWEMVWMLDKPAGTIVCGFHLDQDVQRNDAILKSGSVYFHFTVYTEESLRTMMIKKHNYEERLRSLKKEQDDALADVQEEGNLFKKALLWKRFLDANERLSFMPPAAYETVPNDFDHVLKIGEDLHICTEGNVFIQTNGNDIRHLTVIGDAILRETTVNVSKED